MQNASEPLKLERAVRNIVRVKRLARSASETALLIPILVLLLVAIGCKEKEAAAPPPVPDVEVSDVVVKDVPIYREWVAVLDGYVNAQIQPEVTGYLLAQKYQEGTLCAKGSSCSRWIGVRSRPFSNRRRGNWHRPKRSSRRPKWTLRVIRRWQS